MTHSPNKRDETAEGWDPVAGADLGAVEGGVFPIPLVDPQVIFTIVKTLLGPVMGDFPPPPGNLA